MLLLPAIQKSGRTDLLIVLEDENIERIKEHDPAEVTWNELGSFGQCRPGIIAIGYATPEECKAICEFVQNGKPEKAIALVIRGFQYRPDKGDHDFGPVSLTKKPE